MSASPVTSTVYLLDYVRHPIVFNVKKIAFVLCGVRYCASWPLLPWAKIGNVSKGQSSGRPRNLHPEFLCPRIETMRRIFAQGIDKSDWVQLNRPMGQVYDQREEAERREEYSLLLKRLAYSDLMPG